MLGAGRSWHAALLRPPSRWPQDHWPREPVIPLKAHPLRVCKISEKSKDRLMLLLCGHATKFPAPRRAEQDPGEARVYSLGRGRVEPYDGSVESPGYLRFPHITGDLVVFIAADDVWLAPVAGGRAWRFTTDEAQASTPRLSPDGTHGAGGSGWPPAGEVLAVTAANQPFRHYVRARVLTTVLSGSPGAERVLPFGPVSDLSLGTDADGIRGDNAAADGSGVVGLLTGTWGVFGNDPAHWKRYRGGTAGRLWTGPATAIVSEVPDAAGQVPGPFRRGVADPPTQLPRPAICRGRLAFISDHEGTGNI